MKPFFSIITPSFHQAKYLPACLDSLRHQQDHSYEHIIVDNCSTDGTGSILDAYAHQQAHVKLVIEPDHGQSNAVNKGFRLAQGEVIGWLNSDDAYLPETLKLVHDAFQDPAVTVIFGDVRQIFYDGRPPERAVASFHHRLDFIRWWSSRVRLHQPAIFFRRSVVDRIGCLNESLQYAMDYEYWWRLSAKYRFYYLPEELAIQHRQPDSKTIQAWHHVLMEREKVFAPFYGLLEEKEDLLKKERSQALASHFLLQAYVAAKNHPSIAWFYLQQAWRESPLRVLQPSSLGLIRQLCFPC